MLLKILIKQKQKRKNIKIDLTTTSQETIAEFLFSLIIPHALVPQRSIKKINKIYFMNDIVETLKPR